MMFRVNFLSFWTISNVAFVLLVENITTSSAEVINDGSFGLLEAFACYLAFMVLYKVFFGACHILRFKCKNNCSDKYKVGKVNLKKEYRKIKNELGDSENLLLSQSYMVDEDKEEENDN